MSLKLLQMLCPCPTEGMSPRNPPHSMRSAWRPAGRMAEPGCACAMHLGPANADKGEAPPAGSPRRDSRHPYVVHALLIFLPHISLTVGDPNGQQSHRAAPGLPSQGAASRRRASGRQRPLSEALRTPSPIRKVVLETSGTGLFFTRHTKAGCGCGVSHSGRFGAPDRIRTTRSGRELGGGQHGALAGPRSPR